MAIKEKAFLIEDWGYDGLTITIFENDDLQKAMKESKAFNLRLIIGREISLSYKKNKNGMRRKNSRIKTCKFI